MPSAAEEAFVLAHTRAVTPPLVPELRAYLAEALAPVWEATERLAGETRPPPFWAFAWPGSLALARHVLDAPDLVAGRRVMDFGAGGGLAGIAAARAGAAHVLAVDVDPLAAAAQALNARLNGVRLASATGDLVERPLPGVEVVLAGDVCYERFPARRIERWLRGLAGAGSLVLLADPGRAYAPTAGREAMGRYDVPTTRELEAGDSLATVVWRLLAEPG